MRSVAVVAVLVVGVVVLASVVPGFPDLNPFDTET